MLALALLLVLASVSGGVWSKVSLALRENTEAGAASAYDGMVVGERG